MFGIGDTIIRGAQDLLQQFFWTIINPLLMLINSLLDALFHGVLGLDIFTENTFLSTAFTCSLALMFLIIPVKFVYEIVTSMIKDDDSGLDLQKKMGSALLGIMIACSLTVVVTKVVNPVVQDITNVMLGINLTEQNENGEENYQIGDSLIETVLVSFGGMPTEGEYGAKEFVNQYNQGKLNITERYDQEVKDGNGEVIHQKYEYKWNVGLFMCIIGCAIYVILLFIITIQIAVRMISIGFYYIIGPLCCTSMTNYQNPQAFVVWKNTLVGQWAQNLAQIFLLSLAVSVLDAITRASQGYPIAMLALYFGAFSLTISVPSFIQAMIGGYSAGIFDIMNTARSGVGMATSLVAGAVGAVMGRHSSATGHMQGGMRGAIEGDKQADGRRMGGLRGAVMGNLQQDGTRQGGVKEAVMGREMNVSGIHGRTGGLRGAVMGNDTLQEDVNGGIAKTRKGGAVGAIRGGSTTQRYNAQGEKFEKVRKPRLSSLRGEKVTSYGNTSQEPSGASMNTGYQGQSNLRNNLNQASHVNRAHADQSVGTKRNLPPTPEKSTSVNSKPQKTMTNLNNRGKGGKR